MDGVGLQNVMAQRVLLAQQQRQALGSRHLKWPGGIGRPWKEKSKWWNGLTANGKETEARLCGDMSNHLRVRDGGWW